MTFLGFRIGRQRGEDSGDVRLTDADRAFREAIARAYATLERSGKLQNELDAQEEVRRRRERRVAA